jgi:hypothetical protein
MSDPVQPIPHKVMVDGPPPFLGTWSRVYTVVLLYLVAVIFGLYEFSAMNTP